MEFITFHGLGLLVEGIIYILPLIMMANLVIFTTSLLINAHLINYY